MNRLLTTTDLALRAGSYASPRTTVTEIVAEGVLCLSGPSNEGWGEENPDW